MEYSARTWNFHWTVTMTSLLSVGDTLHNAKVYFILTTEELLALEGFTPSKSPYRITEALQLFEYEEYEHRLQITLFVPTERAEKRN